MSSESTSEPDASSKASLVTDPEPQPSTDFLLPVEKRSCTDIVFLIVFTLAVLLLVVVGVYACLAGDARLLVYPIDSRGGMCGDAHTGLAQRRYLLFFDLTVCSMSSAAASTRRTWLSFGAGLSCPSPQVCQPECPHTNWYWENHRDEATVSGALCDVGVNSSTVRGADLEQLVTSGQCAGYYLKSITIANRCIPSIFLSPTATAADAQENGKPIYNSQKKAIDANMMSSTSVVLGQAIKSLGRGDRLVKDLMVSGWLVLVLGGLGALALTLLWCLLMHLMPRAMLWGTIGVLVAVLAAGSLVCIYLGLAAKQITPPSMRLAVLAKLESSPGYFLVPWWLWLVTGVVLGLLALLVVLLSICFIDSIRLAVQIFVETGRCLAWNMSAFVFPVWSLMVQLAVLLLVVYVLFGLLTANTNRLVNAHCLRNSTVVCNYLRASWAASLPIYFSLFVIFMGFWLWFFNVALSQITLAGSFTTWYWQQESSSMANFFPILRALWRALRYHVGSLALGSLLVAVVSLIRWLLTLLKQKLTGSENVVARCLLCVFSCFFWCLEAVLKFITKQAFIYMAMFGKNFCRSAHKVFGLAVNHGGNIVMLDNWSDLVLLLARLIIVAVCATATWFATGEWMRTHAVVLNYGARVPTVFAAMLALLVSSVLLDVWSVATGTIYNCVLVDVERNDGSAAKPYKMSDKLAKVLMLKKAEDGKEETKSADNEKSKGCLFCC